MNKKEKRVLTSLLMTFAQPLTIVLGVAMIGGFFYGVWILFVFILGLLSGFTSAQIGWTVVSLIIVIILIYRFFANYNNYQEGNTFWDRLFN